MNKELIFNTDLHFEHENWNRELNFWKDELITFQNRLNELNMRWTDKSILAEIEKFQNQFTVHKEAINSIQDQIEMHETNMAGHYQKKEDVLNKSLVQNHLLCRDKMETQRTLYNELKRDFFRLLTRYL